MPNGRPLSDRVASPGSGVTAGSTTAPIPTVSVLAVSVFVSDVFRSDTRRLYQPTRQPEPAPSSHLRLLMQGRHGTGNAPSIRPVDRAIATYRHTLSQAPEGP